jgi:AcrR family transcriptional regulator
MTTVKKSKKDKEEAFRTALIDAAWRCYARMGLQDATMADIAEEAGTSRRTLYRSFPSHDLILEAVIRRGIDRFWERFHSTHSDIDDFAEFLLEAMVYAIRNAPKTKTHSVIYHPASLAMVNKLYIDNADYLRDQAQKFGEVYERTRHKPGTRQNLDMLIICEWWNRLAVSYQAVPSPFFRSEKELRVWFTATIVPVVRYDVGADIKPPKKKALK